MIKPRIFISCGQRPEELKIVEQIKNHSGINKHFEPFIAGIQSSLAGIVSTVFERLYRQTEYFVFIDFKRDDREFRSSTGKFAASIFSHRELALAVFLKEQRQVEDIITFSEDGVEERPGILRFLASAPQRFERSKLADQIFEEISHRKWQTNWRCELKIGEPQVSRWPREDQNHRYIKHFHLPVENHHYNLAATNTHVYLESVRCLETGREFTTDVVELKWTGFLYPSAIVRPKRKRPFDAFQFYEDAPTQNEFRLHTDSPRHSVQNLPLGNYEVLYAISSIDFPRIESRYRLHLDSDMSKVVLEPAA
jgi:hypothetical protein